jgi:NhaP-type Na+/H+ or K+/H+ antiporter
MLLLFTFVLLGSSVIWTGLSVINGPTLLFTAIAVLIRTPVYLLSLIGSGVDMRGRLLIAWFGPRGLSSLLLVLLPVFAGLAGSEQLFATCSLVVLVSVVLHGGSPMLLAQAARKRALRESAEMTGNDAAPPPRLEADEQMAQEGSRDEQTVAPVSHGESPTAADGKEVAGSINSIRTRRPGTKSDGVQISPQNISLDELGRLWQAQEPVLLLDVRTERSLEGHDTQAKGAVRMPPDHVAERARELGLKKDAWLITYCA